MALHAQTHPTLDVPDCYACKVAGVAIGFHASPGGKAEFHGATINQRREKILADAKRMGTNIEPVHQSNYYGPVSV